MWSIDNANRKNIQLAKFVLCKFLQLDKIGCNQGIGQPFTQQLRGIVPHVGNLVAIIEDISSTTQAG